MGRERTGIGHNPVQIQSVSQDRHIRFWAILVLGLVVKWVILTSHFLLPGALGLLLDILQILSLQSDYLAGKCISFRPRAGAQSEPP